MKVGLIGLGRHGERYAKHLLAPEAPAQLVAISRRNPEKGQVFAEEHQIRFHQDYHSLIHDPIVEAIIIVTPPSLTCQMAVEAIQQKKPVLIEKPLAISAADARCIVEYADQAHVPIMTAQTLRYEAPITALKERAHEIGKWRYLSMTARLEHRPHSQEEINAWNGRGALMEIGIHLLDLARFLTGEHIHEVHCERPHRDTAGPEDHVWGRLTTQSGIPCLFDISRVSHSRLTKVELIGETGQLCANWSTATLSLQRERHPPEEQTFLPTPTIHSVLEGFTHSLTTGTPMPITGEDGLRAVDIAEACYESLATQQPVKLQHGQ